MTALMLFDPMSLPQNQTGAVTKFSKERIAELFIAFWEIFPKRSGNNPKWKAEQKFTKLVVDGENPETIIAGARRFAAECKRNGTAGRFVPMAITWLNGKMWLNDPDVPEEMPKSFVDIARDLRERAYAAAAVEPTALLSGDGR